MPHRRTRRPSAAPGATTTSRSPFRRRYSSGWSGAMPTSGWSMAGTMGQELIGVGRSNNPDPREAGAEAARRAADMPKPAEIPAWVLLFCGGKHDPAAVLAGLRGVVGPLPVVGGSAAGAVTSTGFGYSGFEVAVGLFPEALGIPDILTDSGLLQGEAETGRRLGEGLR